VTTLQALLAADARRDTQRTERIGARWKTTMMTMTMTRGGYGGGDGGGGKRKKGF